MCYIGDATHFFLPAKRNRWRRKKNRRQRCAAKIFHPAGDRSECEPMPHPSYQQAFSILTARRSNSLRGGKFLHAAPLMAGKLYQCWTQCFMDRSFAILTLECEAGKCFSFSLLTIVKAVSFSLRRSRPGKDSGPFIFSRYPELLTPNSSLLTITRLMALIIRT